MNRLRHPGLVIRPGAFLTEIIFQEPVFSYRSEISTEAQNLLRFIGLTLQPWLQHLQIRVTGHTDDDPVSGAICHSNVDLGFQRAAAAAEFLCREGRIPADRLTTASAGEHHPPYPNNSPENKTRNRTVTIQITR